MNRKTLTGRDRKRETSFRVRFADKLARSMITAAGLGTIVAVSGIFIFLCWVVIPLFIPGSLKQDKFYVAKDDIATGSFKQLAIDDFEVIAWAYREDHTLSVLRLDTGEELVRHKLFADSRQPQTYTISPDYRHMLFGFADGTIQTVVIDFASSFLTASELAEPYLALKPGELARYKNGVLQLTASGQYRLQEVRIEWHEPLAVAENQGVILVDQALLNSGPVYCSLDESGVFRIQAVRTTSNLLTGELKHSLSGGQIRLDWPEARGMPTYLFLEGRADSALVIWKDGFAIRLDTRNRNRPVIAEKLQLLDSPSRTLTAVTALIGKMTLVTGDSNGQISTWFRVRPGDADGRGVPQTSDASVLMRISDLAVPKSAKNQAVSAFAVSQRTRSLLAGYENGKAALFYVTSKSQLAEFNAFPNSQVRISALGFSPKDNGMLISSEAGIAKYWLDFPHPQITFSTIFKPVWYEGASEAAHVWQSSSGTDEFEPKYGMIPLVFGTLKATFYTMLFAAPLALLAAVFTSEFLGSRLRSCIKPVIEMMASLPSVVLGFLAALIFAPIVEQILPGIIASLITLPFCLLLASYLWQLLPLHLSLCLQPYRLLLMFPVILVGFFLAIPVGKLAEATLFAGNIKAWLAFQGADSTSPFAAATGGWFLLMLPVCALIVCFSMVQLINPLLARKFSGQNRLSLALSNLLKFLLGTILTITAAWLFSSSLSSAGLDARGSYIDTYVQRNALIVGFIMGFAVIPLIYTIAEDALASVPEYLRAASLAAGATPWQTAIRIIIPTAMSGLFSALMMGFGRAVGETMIVLMAAGNTPIMEWNIFNGFRTLSANIAVELPEAVQNGSNYRMLFFAALTLFVLTFVMNTVAEIVRQRFRRRAYQL